MEEARQCLRASLENSKLLSSAIDGTSSRLASLNKKVLSLVTEVRSSHAQMCTHAAVRRHVERVIGPASAVVKAHDAVQGLERLLMSDACGDTFAYLTVIKQMEEALRFLNDNCGLVVQWMEDIVNMFDDHTEAANAEFALNARRLLRILEELKAMEGRAYLKGGLLSDAYDKLEIEFQQLLVENLAPIGGEALEEIGKLHAILERLKSNDRLENCMAIYVDVRSSSVRAVFKSLNTLYNDIEVSEFVSVRTIEDHITQWSKDIKYAVKQILETEHEISKKVFEKVGLEISLECFAKVAARSGFLSLLQFGYKVTHTKKDAIKLLKLLDVFSVLENLRLDFNRLFGGKHCMEIQALTRDLVRDVINEACEIFEELPAQVELQQNIPLPSDGGVPRLVAFVTNFCIMLLDDDYGPILSQAASIHHIWNQERSTADGTSLGEVLRRTMRALEINLEKWSNTYKNDALTYFFLLNNYHYLCETVRGTKFTDLMGENWLRKREQRLEYYTTAYLKELGKASGYSQRQWFDVVLSRKDHCTRVGLHEAERV